MFVIFLIKEHPSHSCVEACFQQEISCEDGGIDAYDLVVGQDKCLLEGGLAPEEEEQRIEQAGLQHEEELEAQLRACFGDDGGAFALWSEEVFDLSAYEVARLGDGQRGEDETSSSTDVMRSSPAMV